MAELQRPNRPHNKPIDDVLARAVADELKRAGDALVRAYSSRGPNSHFIAFQLPSIFLRLLDALTG